MINTKNQKLKNLTKSETREVRIVNKMLKEKNFYLNYNRIYIYMWDGTRRKVEMNGVGPNTILLCVVSRCYLRQLI